MLCPLQAKCVLYTLTIRLHTLKQWVDGWRLERKGERTSVWFADSKREVTCYFAVSHTCFSLRVRHVNGYLQLYPLSLSLSPPPSRAFSFIHLTHPSLTLYLPPFLSSSSYFILRLRE